MHHVSLPNPCCFRWCGALAFLSEAMVQDVEASLVTCNSAISACGKALVFWLRFRSKIKNWHMIGIFRLVLSSHERFSEFYQHQESSIYVVQSRKFWKRKVSKHRGWIGDFRWMLYVWSLIFNIFIVKVQRFWDSWNQKAIKQDVTHECKTRMRWDSKNWIPTDRQKVGCLWVLKILHEVDAESQQLPKAFLDGKEIHSFIAVSIYTSPKDG